MLKLDSNDGALTQLANLAALRERTTVHIPEFPRFDPVQYWGTGYRHCTLDSAYRPDRRNMSLYNTFLDLSEVVLRPVTIPDGATNIRGAVRYDQLMAIQRRFMRLGSSVFEQVVKNESKIPDSWKRKIDGRPITILFDGEYYLDRERRLIVPCTTFEDPVWEHGFHWVEDRYGPLDFSAMLLLKALHNTDGPEVLCC